MAIPFSLLTSKRPSPPTSKAAETGEVAAHPVGGMPAWVEPATEPQPVKSPFPMNVPGAVPPPLPVSATDGFGQDLGAAETLVFPPLPATPPHAGSGVSERGRESRGLAALAVHQSGTEAPPINRRPPSQSLPAMNPFPVEVPVPAREALPAPAHWSSANETKTPEAYDGLRQELRGEIEEVKSDLFGAAMGVSALKDRLDGLESQMSQKQAGSAYAQTQPNRQEIESWMSAWLDEHLPDALDRAVTAAQQRALGKLSTQAWFRQPVSFPPADRLHFLAQPPVILTSSPV